MVKLKTGRDFNVKIYRVIQELFAPIGTGALMRYAGCRMSGTSVSF
jgi:hypothetical protein